MVTYLRDSLLSLLVFSCDVCLVTVVLPIQMSMGGRGSFLLLSSSGRFWCTPMLARALAALPCPCACTCACFSPLLRGSLLTCIRHGSTHLFGYLCSLSCSSARRGMQHTCATPSLPVSCRVLRVLAPLFSLFKRACGPWFTPLLSSSCVHTPLWCPLPVALPVCAASHVTYLRGCNILTSPTSFRVSCVAAPLYSLCKWACGGGGFVMPWPLALYLLSPLLYLTVLCLLWRILALCGFPHRGAVYFILALDTAPHNSLATFVRCPSRVRGVTCNILVWLPPYPHLFMFCVLRHRRTPYASGHAGAGVLHVCVHGLILAVCLHRGAICNILALSLPTSYRIVLATASFSVAWHKTYLFFGGRWRCCCSCVLYLHPARLHTPLWPPLFVVHPACAA